MIRKRSLLCVCESIYGPNVCTKLAVQFLLSVNCQGNILLRTEGHSPYTLTLAIETEGKAGAVTRGCMMHNSFNHTYYTGTASNVTQGRVKRQKNTFTATARHLE